MTEAEWLDCVEPRAMLAFLRDGRKASERQLRLFACACCRVIWDLMPDERSREAVEVAERYAEAAALDQAYEAFVETEPADCGPDPSSAAEATDPQADVITRAWEAAHAACAADEDWGDMHSDLLREIVGNPFRPVAADPAWLTWNGGTVPQLARAIYEEQAFDRLPVLADALEEAGCADPRILGHCRGPGPHVRGCWALDLMLGKG